MAGMAGGERGVGGDQDGGFVEGFGEEVKEGLKEVKETTGDGVGVVEERRSMEGVSKEGFGEEEVRERRSMGTAELDPLMNPVVLDNLFGMLPLEELGMCRLVCSLWRKVSLSTWRSKATLKLKMEDGVIVSKQDDGSISRASLRGFLWLWKFGDWDSRPFTKFNLQRWSFEPGHGEQERFLEVVGGHATSLTLERCSFVGRENFRRVIFRAFPNLQRLKMVLCEVDGNENWTEDVSVYTPPAFGVHGLKSLEIFFSHPHSIMDLLCHFHKLDTLRMREVGHRVYRNLLETIRLIRAEDHTKLPLRSFDVPLEYDLGDRVVTSVQLLQLVEQIRLPLQRLEIHFDPEQDENRYADDEDDIDMEDEDEDDDEEDGSNVIRDILQNHASTLKYLKFEKRGGVALSKSFPFGVQLENLEELHLWAPGFTRNLNFLRYTPNLRVLVVDERFGSGGMIFWKSTELEVGAWTLASLTELTFSMQMASWNLKKLIQWFPNVKRLSMDDVNDVNLSIICNRWEKLEELMHWGKVPLTDEGVIGRGNVPTIANLKRLTKFVSPSRKLTSASVLDGFLKLTNLKVLSLRLWLDDDVEDALKRKKIKYEKR